MDPTCFRPVQICTSPRILLLNMTSGGAGLNITEAQHVLFAEPLLDAAAEAQAIGRVHRIGQTRETHVHRCGCCAGKEVVESYWTAACLFDCLIVDLAASFVHLLWHPVLRYPSWWQQQQQQQLPQQLEQLFLERM
eukprot:scaffold301448_cov17-Tisochrysis_lutea.AAC.2